MNHRDLEIEIKTAKELLSIMALENDLWLEQGHWKSDWVFRGQSCAKWDLTPSAWRDDDSKQMYSLKLLRSAYEGTLRPILEEDYKRNPNKRLNFEYVLKAWSQATAERILKNEFCNLADDVGINIPSNHLTFKGYTPNIADANGLPIGQLGNHFDASTAAAQHHGILTYALDWTYNPKVALHFASKIEGSDDTHIAIWAINTKRFQTKIDPADLSTELKRISFEKFQFSENEYLKVQKGLFTYHAHGYGYYAVNGKWPTYIDSISHLDANTAQSAIKKFTMPRNEVFKLIRLLSAQNISQAHLMPTLDNVAQTVYHKYGFEQAEETYNQLKTDA